MYGALLAGIEDRISAYVLLTPVPTWYQWFRLVGVEENAEYQAAFVGLDPATFAAHASVPIFYQFADNDTYVKEADRTTLTQATTGDIEFTIYEANHQMQRHEQALADRIAFLTEHLGLSEP